ncbi:MAG TPA: STAS domain-containing protein [Anaeromyxobacter sp.]
MLQVRFEQSELTLIVTPITPRLDAAVALEFRDALLGPARERSAVVVDLVHVAWIDASGLAALVSVMKAMRPGTELRLARATPAVRALLARTGLDEVLRPVEGSAHPLLV